MKEYTIEVWYRYGDNEKDFEVFKIKSNSEAEAIREVVLRFRIYKIFKVEIIC